MSGDFFTDRGNWLCSAYQHPGRRVATGSVETGEKEYVQLCFNTVILNLKHKNSVFKLKSPFSVLIFC